MIYQSEQDWRDAKQKRVALFGMSGLGKTHVSNILRHHGDWFHYSVDYRIGTRYMGEDILDNAKRHAMKVPFLANMLKSDSIYIGSNISFDNLAPLSAYLGQPGSPALGGIPIDEYRRRQRQHVDAEIAALLDTPRFVTRAHDIYGYDNFVCDTGGSICEVVNPKDPNDPVLKTLSETALMVWIKGTDDHADSLIKRFSAAPKPMCYSPDFLDAQWNVYKRDNGVSDDEVDPIDFARKTYAQALSERQPKYAAMSDWGITVTANDISAVKSPDDFIELIARTLR